MRILALSSVLLSVLACTGGSTTEAPGGPAADGVGASGEIATTRAAYAGRFASDPALTPNDLFELDKPALRLLRNEIYARHGREFESPELRAHFEGQPWYAADPAYSDDRLSENDKKNAALIQSFETDADPLATDGSYGFADTDPRYADGPSLIMIDADTAHFMPNSSVDLYTWEPVDQHLVARGDWVVTWEGPTPWPGLAGASNVQLWRIDHNRDVLVDHVIVSHRGG
jgi:hypothetical protein